jgi:hypothetical protein
MMFEEVVELCKSKTPGIGQDIADMLSSSDPKTTLPLLKCCCYFMPEKDQAIVRDTCMSMFLPLTDGTVPKDNEFVCYLIDAVLWFSDKSSLEVFTTAYDWFSEEVQYWIQLSLKEFFYDTLDPKKQPYTLFDPLAKKCFETFKNDYNLYNVGIAYDLIAVTDPKVCFTLTARVLKSSAAERHQDNFRAVYDPFLLSMTLAGGEYKERAKHILRQKDVALMHEACFPENDYVEGI